MLRLALSRPSTLLARSPRDFPREFGPISGGFVLAVLKWAASVFPPRGAGVGSHYLSIGECSVHPLPTGALNTTR